MARPGSRVRLLETPSNRRPREMIVAPLTRGTEPGLQAFSGARSPSAHFLFPRDCVGLQADRGRLRGVTRLSWFLMLYAMAIVVVAILPVGRSRASHRSGEG